MSHNIFQSSIINGTGISWNSRGILCLIAADRLLCFYNCIQSFFNPSQLLALTISWDKDSHHFTTPYSIPVGSEPAMTFTRSFRSGNTEQEPIPSYLTTSVISANGRSGVKNHQKAKLKRLWTLNSLELSPVVGRKQRPQFKWEWGWALTESRFD